MAPLEDNEKRTASMLSVAIPNYNDARYLREAVNAIRRQSWPPDEIVVLDDGSTDESLDIIAGLVEEDRTIRLIRHQRNEGVLRSANRLLEEVQGRYVYFGSANDRVLPGFFERSMAMLCRHPQAALCSAVAMQMDAQGRLTRVHLGPTPSGHPAYFPPTAVPQKLRKTGNWIQGLTTIYRRAAVLEVGGFPSGLGGLADTYVATLAAARHGACYVPLPLVAYRQLEDSFSRRALEDMDSFLAILWELRRLLNRDASDLLTKDYARQWDYELRIARTLSILESHDLPRTELADALTRIDPTHSPVLGRLAAGLRPRHRGLLKLVILVRYRPWSLLKQRLRGSLAQVLQSLGTRSSPKPAVDP